MNCIHPGQYKPQTFMTIHPDENTGFNGNLPAHPIGAIVEDAGKNPEYAKINVELAASFKNNPPMFTPRE